MVKKLEYKPQDIVGAGGGGKGGGGSPRTPVEYPDSLQSTSYAAVVDLISSGEVAGPADPMFPLKSVYLDGTPIQNDDLSLNFQGVEYDYRVGTIDQTYIKGFPESATPIGVGTEVKFATPWVRAITDKTLSAVRITLHIPQLIKYIESGDTAGDRVGSTVNYAIDLSTDSGAYETIISTSFSGKTTGGYTRTHRIDLPEANSGWQVRVRRLTPDSSTSALTDTFLVQVITEVTDGKLTHPMLAMSGMRVSAEHFQSIPTRAYDWKGKIIRVPTNYDPETRVYTGVWDGTFKKAWSNNPAWVYYDLLLDPINGLGSRLNASQIDRYALYQIGYFCDQEVPDGMGGMEPRFTCNLYIQSQEDALAVLDDLASAFRGIAYWNGEEVVAVADMPSDPVYTYTNANIVGGRVEYTGAPLDTLYTVALVSYNDPSDFYRAKVVSVRDPEGIRAHGIRKIDVTAFGCTSRGQAHRLGLYMLYTSRMESGGASFSVGLDGIHCQPGDLIKLADQNRAGRAIGGRVSGVHDGRIALDNATEIKVGDRLFITLPDGTLDSSLVSEIVWDGDGDFDAIEDIDQWDDLQFFSRENGKIVKVNPAFSFYPAKEASWAIDSNDLVTQTLRVVSVKEENDLTYTISAVFHNPNKFQEIDNGVRLDPLPVSVVPPRVQAAPTNIEIEEFYHIHQGVSSHSAEITWDAAEYAVKYDVQWKRDNSDWVAEPRTTSTLVTLNNIYQGDYIVRVRAINALEVPSLWTYSSVETLSGQVSAPPVVTHLTTTGEVMAIRLSWGFPNTPSIVDRVEIRASGTNDFAESYYLTTVAYPTTEYTLQNLSYSAEMWFWVRLIDKNGTLGDWYPAEGGAGVLGTPSQDSGVLLDALSGQITSGELAQDLVEEIEKIPSIELQANKIPAMELLTDKIPDIERITGGLLTGDEDGWFAGDIDGAYMGDVNLVSAFNEDDFKEALIRHEFANRTDESIAQIRDYQIVQTTEHNALAQRVSQVDAQVGSAHSRITSLEKSWIEEFDEGAIAEAIVQMELESLLEAPGGPIARIADLEQTRVTAGEAENIAESTSQSIVEAELAKPGGVNAQIQTLQNTKVTEGQAEAIAVSQLTARVDGKFTGEDSGDWYSGDDDNNFVGAITTTYVINLGDFLEAKRTSELRAEIGDSLALIRDGQLVQTDLHNALAQTVSQSLAQIGDNAAEILRLEQVKVTQTQAESLIQSEISSKFDGPTGVDALILNLQTTKVDAGQAESIAQSEVSARLQGLAFGGRNLLTNTSEDWQTISHTVYFATLGSVVLADYGIESDAEISLKVFIKTGATAQARARLRWKDSGGTAFANNTGNLVEVSSEGWSEVTAKIPNNAVSVDALIDARLGGTNAGVTGTFDVKFAKMERGSAPTDWTPSPADIEASIGNLQSTKVDANQAEAIVVEELTAKVTGEHHTGDNNGEWYAGDDAESYVGAVTITSVINKGDFGEALRVNQLAVAVGNSLSTLTNQQLVQAQDHLALAQSFTVLESSIGANAASIKTLAETKVTQSEVNATVQSELSSRFDGPSGVSALIQNLETTKVDASQASSIAQSEVSAELDGPEGLRAIAQQTSEALTTLDGKLKATYQNKLEVYSGNRLVQTGFAMGAAIGEDGTSKSEFLIHADTFGLLTKKNGVTHSPFIFDVANDTVFLKNAFIENGTITNAKIANGTIEAAKIKNGEITSAKIASGAITTAKIDDAAIVSAKIGTAEVGTLKLAGNSVSISVGVTVNSNSTSFNVAPVDSGSLIIIGEVNPSHFSGGSITISAGGIGTLAVLHPNSYTVTEYDGGEAGNPYERTYYQSRVQLAVVSIPAGSRTITVSRSNQAVSGYISFNLAMR